MKQLLLAVLLFPIAAFSQGYTSYFTGNTTNITTTTAFGVCMMGGASEHDNAMRWLLQKANGGDVVVLRSSGSNGYNNYLYTELGITVNSVETLVITSVAGAINPYVLDKVANAEMIWFAGGDQYNYVSYFKDNALETILNNHINVKHAPIGGTSAGMAILGGKYFSAANGSVTSTEAMANPYNPYVTIGSDDFLSVPFMHDVITDTHYDYYDRRGRQAAFLGRWKQDTGGHLFGIACNEYVAVCVNEYGRAYVYGDFPNYQEFAYFIQPNCLHSGVEAVPEVCHPNTPLTWNYGGEAIKAYKVPGTMNGEFYYDLNVWQEGNGYGGAWESWSVINGLLQTVSNNSYTACILANPFYNGETIGVAPNPFHHSIVLENAQGATVSIYDVLGKKVFSVENFQAETINTADFENGLYFVKTTKDRKNSVKKLVKN